jgi:hypothetical protein
VDDVAQTDPMPMDNCESGADIKYHLAKDFNGLADMYWVLSFLYSFLLFRISRSKTIWRKFISESSCHRHICNISNMLCI